jgi:integrase
MAWHEIGPSNFYFVCFRVGEKRFRRSLKTKIRKEADILLARLEGNLLDIERGRLFIPENSDPVTFLLSDGRVSAPLEVSKQRTLKELFDSYFKAIPSGSLEDSTISGMKTHQKHLQKILKSSFPVNALSLENLQDYVTTRSKAKGRKGYLSPATCKKEVITFRTVWNWGLRSKLVDHPFPSRGLKYPKASEKPPFMSFAEVEELTKEMKTKEAAEFWEAVYLPVEDIDSLLKHVETNRTPFVYPMFCFGFHTGARRSEMLRARVSDVDLKNGWVTIHERKKAHDRKTTRRVPISAFLQTVLADWLAKHPGGTALFCHESVVARSKKRSLTTGHVGKGRATTLAERLKTVRIRTPRGSEPITGDEAHDHFKSALAGTKWAKLKGWHVMRHSFISALACKGVDQRIIDDFTGHQTDEQRRRYRHLLPATTKQAIAAVFG